MFVCSFVCSFVQEESERLNASNASLEASLSATQETLASIQADHQTQSEQIVTLSAELATALETVSVLEAAVASGAQNDLEKSSAWVAERANLLQRQEELETSATAERDEMQSAIDCLRLELAQVHESSSQRLLVLQESLTQEQAQRELVTNQLADLRSANTGDQERAATQWQIEKDKLTALHKARLEKQQLDSALQLQAALAAQFDEFEADSAFELRAALGAQKGKFEADSALQLQAALDAQNEDFSSKLRSFEERAATDRLDWEAGRTALLTEMDALRSKLTEEQELRQAEWNRHSSQELAWNTERSQLEHQVSSLAAAAEANVVTTDAAGARDEESERAMLMSRVLELEQMLLQEMHMTNNDDNDNNMSTVSGGGEDRNSQKLHGEDEFEDEFTNELSDSIDIGHTERVHDMESASGSVSASASASAPVTELLASNAHLKSSLDEACLEKESMKRQIVLLTDNLHLAHCTLEDCQRLLRNQQQQHQQQQQEKDQEQRVSSETQNMDSLSSSSLPTIASTSTSLPAAVTSTTATTAVASPQQTALQYEHQVHTLSIEMSSLRMLLTDANKQIEQLTQEKQQQQQRLVTQMQTHAQTNTSSMSSSSVGTGIGQVRGVHSLDESDQSGNSLKASKSVTLDTNSKPVGSELLPGSGSGSGETSTMGSGGAGSGSGYGSVSLSRKASKATFSNEILTLEGSIASMINGKLIAQIFLSSKVGSVIEKTAVVLRRGGTPGNPTLLDNSLAINTSPDNIQFECELTGSDNQVKRLRFRGSELRSVRRGKGKTIAITQQDGLCLHITIEGKGELNLSLPSDMERDVAVKFFKIGMVNNTNSGTYSMGSVATVSPVDVGGVCFYCFRVCLRAYVIA